MLTDAAVGHAVGLRSLDQETEPTPLAVEGEIPAWITGSLLRTGPARFEVGGQSMRHWFDGLAMLHRFAIAGGEVTYGGRFLRSKAFEHAERTGEIGFPEFATDPCRSIFARAANVFSPSLTDNGNVNVVRLGDETLALTETPLPVAFEPDTLRTLGVTGWAERIPGQLTVAHPHEAGGELVSYAAHLGARNRYRLYAVRPGGDVRVLADVPVDQPSYMHAFALTERYAVLTEWPLVLNPLRLLTSGKPFIENYRWRPERGTRYTVIDRADGTVRARIEGPAAFAFHHINAFEDGDDVVLDLCAYEDASIIDRLYLDRARAGGEVPPATPQRHRVSLTRGEVAVEPLADVNLELPRIDYRGHNGRPYRYAYGASSSAGGWLDALVKLDVATGETTAWSHEGLFAGEPVFVGDPEGHGEDAGVLLSVVLDAHRETSFLLVLDAATFEERARAEVPHAIPFHFHGTFTREAG